jgi:hypothetical protein
MFLLASCILTLCFGEVHATLAEKPHSEIFDATLGSLIGFCVGRFTGRELKEKPIKPAPPAKKK